VITVRSALLPADRDSIAAIDRSFETRQTFDLSADGSSVRLVARSLADPVAKTFPLDDLDDPNRPWDAAWVAEADGRVVGFAAAGWQAWNRRCVLWHLYVDAAARGLGAGRMLIEAALAHARGLGARHLWLETSTLNVPGVAAYRALGFTLTGADLTLYDGTPAEGEGALFFSAPVD
jgi:ribosomal protein S18 acetylase RimI-like enzyme